jgi:CHASE3 domain sensor protein
VPYRQFRRKLTASYLAPFIIAMALLASAVLWRSRVEVSIVNWVEHSDQVLLRTKDAELEMRDMMLAVRAYLLTSDKKFLTELKNAQRRFAKELSGIAALVGDNPEQEQR